MYCAYLIEKNPIYCQIVWNVKKSVIIFSLDVWFFKSEKRRNPPKYNFSEKSLLQSLQWLSRSVTSAISNYYEGGISSYENSSFQLLFFSYTNIPHIRYFTTNCSLLLSQPLKSIYACRLINFPWRNNNPH